MVPALFNRLVELLETDMFLLAVKNSPLMAAYIQVWLFAQVCWFISYLESFRRDKKGTACASSRRAC